MRPSGVGIGVITAAEADEPHGLLELRALLGVLPAFHRTWSARLAVEADSAEAERQLASV